MTEDATPAKRARKPRRKKVAEVPTEAPEPVAIEPEPAPVPAEPAPITELTAIEVTPNSVTLAWPAAAWVMLQRDGQPIMAGATERTTDRKVKPGRTYRYELFNVKNRRAVGDPLTVTVTTPEE